MKKRTVPIANAQALFFSNGQIQMDNHIKADSVPTAQTMSYRI